MEDFSKEDVIQILLISKRTEESQLIEAKALLEKCQKQLDWTNARLEELK